jgi:type I restriction enzyme R subunit
MKSNFIFLHKKFQELEIIGSLAEDYLYTDVNSSLIKLGLFGETIVNLMFILDDIKPLAVENIHANRIKLLIKKGLIPIETENIFMSLRKSRNKAIHEGYASYNQAIVLLEMAYHLGIWFMQTYGNPNCIPVDFFLPENRTIDYLSALKEKEKTIEKLCQEITKYSPDPKAICHQREMQSQAAAQRLNLGKLEERLE